MKVVINKCFGGFGLSDRAIYELIKKQAKCISKTPISEHYGSAGMEGFQKDVDKGHIVDFDDDPEFKKTSYGVFYDAKYAYSLECHEDSARSDPDLIKIVEKLKDAANGQCAKLEIVNIPDGISWHVEEYDGNEHIAENHRTWN